MATIVEEEAFENKLQVGETAVRGGLEPDTKVAKDMADTHSDSNGTEVREVSKFGRDEGQEDNNMHIDDSGVIETADANEDSDGEQEGEKLPSQLYQRLMKQRCTACCISRFPRSCAIFIGVLVPLGILILISLVFGILLCEYESPPEFDHNDDRVAELYWATQSQERLVNLTGVLPRVCFALYLSQQNGTAGILPQLITSGDVDSNASDILEPFLEEATKKGLTDPLDLLIIPDLGEDYPSIVPEDFDPETITINATDFYNFLSQCGMSARETVDKLISQSAKSIAIASDALTFNWILCFVGAKEGRRNFGGGGLNSTERSIEGQTKVYVQEWETDREQLFEEKYAMYIADGMEPGLAGRTAAEEAAREATGRTTCELNVPSAAWFWFTVQTTIGYGNTPPTTTGSRAMVYTVGFFAILGFGGVLAVAGYLLAFLFDDYCKRIGWHFLAIPWVGCLIWATCYYVWMVVIAGVTIRWKEARLAESMDMRDGYWFAYISTTTVGLGDIVLEPQGLIGADLFYFPAMFLAGLMFFAAFIGKFAELILRSIRRNRESFVDTLLQKKVTWKETFQKEQPT